MFGNLGMWEVLIILFIVLLLFGARRLPEIGSSLGKGIREFKSSVKEIEGEVKEIQRGVESEQGEAAEAEKEKETEPRT